MLENMARGDSRAVWVEGVLQVDPKNAIILPSGLLMRYDEFAG